MTSDVQDTRSSLSRWADSIHDRLISSDGSWLLVEAGPEFASLRARFLAARMVDEMGGYAIAAELDAPTLDHVFAAWLLTGLEAEARPRYIERHAAVVNALGIKGFRPDFPSSLGLEFQPSLPIPADADDHFDPLEVPPGLLTFNPDKAEVRDSIVTRGLMEFIFTKKIIDSPDGPRYEYREFSESKRPLGTAIITLDPQVARDAQLEKEFRNFSDQDLDTTLVVMARLEEADGKLIRLDAVEVLRARGLAPKLNRDPNNPLARYSGGHRAQDIAEVGRGIDRLASLWLILDRVEVRAKGRKPQIFSEEGRLIELSKRLTRTSLIDGTSLAVGWTMRAGEALSGQIHGLSPLTPIARKVLGYDPYHARWTKRLGVYFTLHMRLPGKGTVVQRRIGPLLEGVGLAWNVRDPSRSWKSLVEALDRLKADQVIADYDFRDQPEPAPLRRSEGGRWSLARSRGWVEPLLATELIVWGAQEPRSINQPFSHPQRLGPPPLEG